MCPFILEGEPDKIQALLYLITPFVQSNALRIYEYTDLVLFAAFFKFVKILH